MGTSAKNHRETKGMRGRWREGEDGEGVGWGRARLFVRIRICAFSGMGFVKYGQILVVHVRTSVAFFFLFFLTSRRARGGRDRRCYQTHFGEEAPGNMDVRTHEHSHAIYKH